MTHPAGAVLTSLAIAMTTGADDLREIGLNKPLAATGLIDALASAPTAHRRVHQLAERISAAETGIDRAMRTLRTRAWAAMGPDNPLTAA